MPAKVIDLTTISKGQLVQVIGDQRTAMNELHNRLLHINTIAQAISIFAFLPYQRRFIAKLLKLSNASASTNPESIDEAAAPSKG